MTPVEICPATPAVWAAFLAFVDSLRGVFYGPGRAIWDGDRYVITYAPGRRSAAGDLKLWPNVKGKLYPSLHCTSLTNLFLSWITGRNELFTHGGNVPDLMQLLASPPILTVKAGVGSWRGFAGTCTLLVPDGGAAVRTGFRRWPVFDARELLDRARAGTLPTFMVFSQSSRAGNDWNTDHHTGVYAVWERRLYRLAADGYKGAAGYSATPVRWAEVTDDNVVALAGAVYRIYGVDTLDGTYPGSGRFARVDLER